MSILFLYWNHIKFIYTFLSSFFENTHICSCTLQCVITSLLSAAPFFSLAHYCTIASISFIAINPGFIACYNGFQEVFIDVDMVKQFLTDVNTVCFLVLGQHTGHEFRGDAMHVEFFFHNCLAWSKVDAYIFSSLSDSQTAILENQLRYTLLGTQLVFLFHIPPVLCGAIRSYLTQLHFSLSLTEICCIFSIISSFCTKIAIIKFSFNYDGSAKPCVRFVLQFVPQIATRCPFQGSLIFRQHDL